MTSEASTCPNFASSDALRLSSPWFASLFQPVQSEPRFVLGQSQIKDEGGKCRALGSIFANHNSGISLCSNDLSLSFNIPTSVKRVNGKPSYLSNDDYFLSTNECTKSSVSGQSLSPSKSLAEQENENQSEEPDLIEGNREQVADATSEMPIRKEDFLIKNTLSSSAGFTPYIGYFSNPHLLSHYHSYQSAFASLFPQYFKFESPLQRPGGFDNFDGNALRSSATPSSSKQLYCLVG